MVDYNKQVKEGIKMIDALAAKGKFTDEDIAFHVTRELGFGERFTKSYLQKALERKFFYKSQDGRITTKEVAD